MLPTASTNTATNVAAWALQGVAAGAMIFTGALPKFTGAFPSPQLFERLGAGDLGRYGVGTVELVTAVFLLVPRLRAVGGVLLAGFMLGAIGSHLGPLGVAPEFTDPVTGEVLAPPLFAMAIGLFLFALTIVGLRRDELPVIGARLVPAGEPATA